MKLVINKCYGGFGLSDAAYAKLIEYGVPARAYVQQERDPETKLYKPQPDNDGLVIFDETLGKSRSMLGNERYWDVWTNSHEHRAHPLIVRVVEELGDAASGRYARLSVVEIPDGVSWHIDEYDGIESVHEDHRSWG